MSNISTDDVDATANRFVVRLPRSGWLGATGGLACDLLWLLGPFAALLGLWWAAVLYWDVPLRVFPSPPDVLKTFVKLIESGELGLNLTASLVRLAIGLSLAVVTGIPFGVLMGTSKVLSDFFTPLLRLFVGISGIAWIPLITLWLGYGPMVCIFIIWNSVFFAIVYNTMLGVRSMPRDLLRVSRSLGAGPLRIFGEVLLPGSLPAIMNGLRSGLGYGWRGLIAAEMIATNAGLGYSIFLAQKYYDTAQIVLTMIILGSLWLILDRLVFAPLERRTIQRWGVIQKA